MIRIHLSKLLGERRWTQAYLAQMTGIRPATISDIYNEVAERLNIEHLDRICEVLDCDLSDLIEYIPNKQKKTGRNLILEEHANRKKKGVGHIVRRLFFLPKLLNKIGIWAAAPLNRTGSIFTL